MTTYIFTNISGERFHVQGDMAAAEFMRITRMRLLGTMPERYESMSYRLIEKDYYSRGTCYIMSFASDSEMFSEYSRSCWLFNLTSEEVGQILGGN
jgi:hypothetical protein